MPHLTTNATRALSVLVVALCLLTASSAQASWWPEGWYETTADIPRPGHYPDLDSLEVPYYWDTAEPTKILSVAFIRFYQTVLSRHRTGNCPFHPSCSRYTLEALSSYGAFWGWLMAVDRIFYRENDAMYTDYPKFDLGRAKKPYDPPEYDYIWRAHPWPMLPSASLPDLFMEENDDAP